MNAIARVIPVVRALSTRNNFTTTTPSVVAPANQTGRRRLRAESAMQSSAAIVHAMAIDGMIKEEEAERLRHLVAAHFGLPPEDVNRLLIEAERQERSAAYDMLPILRSCRATGRVLRRE